MARCVLLGFLVPSVAEVSASTLDEGDTPKTAEEMTTVVESLPVLP